MHADLVKERIEKMKNLNQNFAILNTALFEINGKSREINPLFKFKFIPK